MDDPYIALLIAVSNWLTLALVFVLPLAHILRKADQEELDKANAFVAVLLLFVLMVVTGAALGTPWILLVLGAMLLLFVVIPWIGAAYTGKLHRQLDERYIEKCRLAIRLDPRNAGSHALLAQACAHEGRHAEAVRHFEMALVLAPDPLDNPQYDKWERRLEEERLEKRRCESLFPWWRLRV